MNGRSGAGLPAVVLGGCVLLAAVAWLTAGGRCAPETTADSLPPAVDHEAVAAARETALREQGVREEGVREEGVRERAAEQSVRRFVHRWFADLDRRVPVGWLLPRLSATDLEMVFPERTLRSHAEFADWYEGIGRTYTAHTHTIRALDIRPAGAEIGVTLTVLWTATSMADGTRSTFRVGQRWRLRRTPDRGLLIVKYRIETFHRIKGGGG